MLKTTTVFNTEILAPGTAVHITPRGTSTTTGIITYASPLELVVAYFVRPNLNFGDALAKSSITIEDVVKVGDKEPKYMIRVLGEM